MTAYQHDDGSEMVEYKPGFTVRRDVGLRMGLIAPEVSFGGRRAAPRPAALAPAAPPAPEPVVPPPLQPSHQDLVSVLPEPVAPPIPLVVETATVVVPTPRTVRPRPAKRSLADILAESHRNNRARKGRA